MSSTITAQFKQGVNWLLSNLSSDPRRFAATIYAEVTIGGIFNKKITTYSPYIKLNDEQLCCIINQIGHSAVTKNTQVCVFSFERDLQTNGRESGYMRGDSYLIRAGPLQLVAKITPINYGGLSVIFFDEAPANIKTLLRDIEKNPNIGRCLYPDLQSLKFLGSDSFTNEILIGYILDFIYDTYGKSLSGNILFHSATICDFDSVRYGMKILEYADLGDLEKFARNPINAQYLEARSFLTSEGVTIRLSSFLPQAIVDFTKQLVVNLDFLHKTIEFNHGELMPSNVLVQSTQSRGNYLGVEWDSTVTLKLADFETSSLTMKVASGEKIRVYNRNPATDKYRALSPFRPEVVNYYGEPGYVLGYSLSVTFLNEIRHMGIPYYYSFDLYTFIIGFLMIPEVYYPVMTNESLRRILWEPLWFPDEISTAFIRLDSAIKSNKKITYDVILDVLNGLRLKCRATELVLAGLRTLPPISPMVAIARPI